MSLRTADESEVRELAFILHDAIAGEWVTIRCPNQMSVKRLFNGLCDLADAMGLAYDAYRAVGCEQIVVCDSIWDGGIDFECMSHMSDWHRAKMMSDPRAGRQWFTRSGDAEVHHRTQE